jgi:hypothetical protein
MLPCVSNFYCERSRNRWIKTITIMKIIVILLFFGWLACWYIYIYIYIKNKSINSIQIRLARISLNAPMHHFSAHLNMLLIM